MSRKRLFAAFLILLLYSVSGQARNTADSDRLFSPSVGQKFYEIAYELADSQDVSSRQIDQAIIFLTATANLDTRANYILPDIINFVARYHYLPAEAGTKQNYSQLVYSSLVNYTDKNADLEVAEKAVQYLLEQLDSREEREKLLEEMLENLGGKNPRLDSELAALLGLLIAEKADYQTAAAYLMKAYNNDNYNRLAFAKLSELAGEQIEPAVYLAHLRLASSQNPLDMEAALAFAQYAERLQLYDIAADTYLYCANLFKFLYPSRKLPAFVYLPWAISNYNTQRYQHRALQIAKDIRESNRFDLILEAIAGKAAEKIGDTKNANRILQNAEARAFQLAEESYRSEKVSKTQIKVSVERLAWFYCFIRPDADKAIDWANKAYSIEPNSSTTAAILAYSLVMNGQTDWAKMLIDSYQRNQIADLALAQIQLTQGQRSSAIETLKSAIASDPGSLEAEHAKELLAQHGGEYIPPTDPDIIIELLRNSFPKALAPEFIPPEQLISVQLSVRNNKLSYDNNASGTIVITNNSPEPLVIGDNGLLGGNIRVDADISGDLERTIPNLISVKIRPTSSTEPGQSILIPLRLFTGELRKILLSHPQASLDIEFTLYLDPVIDPDGKLINRISGIMPVKTTVSRPDTKLTSKFLQNRFDAFTKGRQGQKIKTARLFASLLAEQQAMAGREPLYKFAYADWMPAMLKSGLLHNLAGDDWVTKVHTMAAMTELTLDYEMINAASGNLNDTHWPARMMAVYLLAKSQDGSFKKVLDWTAKYDPNKLVRDMAIALGATAPKAQEPAEQPATNSN